MKYKIDDSHSSDSLKVSLNQDEVFKSRAKAVSTYGGDVVRETQTTRGIFKALDSRENFPITKINVERGSGVVTIVPPYLGEIMSIDIDEGMKLQTLAFLGATSDLDVDLKVGDIYDNDSLGSLNINKNGNGENTLFISGYGGIEKIDLSDNQQSNVKEDYLIGFDNTVSYKKIKKSNLKSKALGAGDKPVVKLTGPGSVYTHIRSPIKNKEVFDKI